MREEGSLFKVQDSRLKSVRVHGGEKSENIVLHFMDPALGKHV
jgi:hypothetical protein